MGWEHIWYVGTGWRKRLVVTLLGGHAWLRSSVLSRAATPLLGTSCRTGWPGTCVPWAYKAVKAWDTDLTTGEGSTGRAVVSAQCLKQQLHTGMVHTTRRSGDPGPKQREMCCWAWVTRESTPITLQCQWGVTACISPPGKSLPDNLTPWCLHIIAELWEECKCFIDHGVEFHLD